MGLGLGVRVRVGDRARVGVRVRVGVRARVRGKVRVTSAAVAARGRAGCGVLGLGRGRLAPARAGDDVGERGAGRAGVLEGERRLHLGG